MTPPLSDADLLRLCDETLSDTNRPREYPSWWLRTAQFLAEELKNRLSPTPIEGSDDPGTCTRCGVAFELVRPGKSQPTCACWDDVTAEMIKAGESALRIENGHFAVSVSEVYRAMRLAATPSPSPAREVDARYLVFAGDCFPAGGWRNFFSSFQDIGEAAHCGKDRVEKYNDWYQVVDLHTMKIVDEYRG